MRLLKGVALFIALALLPVASHAATFYIDFAASDDSGAATKLDPWKRSPGMVGFGGTYVHSAGDVFVFKGGTTWDNSALPLTVTNSGGIGTPDQYTVDETWYAGASFSPPVFDAQATDTALVVVNGSNVTVNGLDLANLKAVAFGDFSIEGTGDNVTASNCIVRNWQNVDNTLQDHKWGGINLDNNWTVDNCTISGDVANDNANGVGVRGSAVTGATIKNSTISGVPNAMVFSEFSNSSIFGNDVHSLHASASEATHENGIVCTNCTNIDFYWNVFHGIPSTVPMGVYVGVTGEGTSGNIRMWNHLFYDLGDVQAIAYESVINGVILNNTIDTGGSAGIRLHGTVPCDNVTIKNNISISTSNAAMIVEGGTHSIDYNLYMASGGVGEDVWANETLIERQAAGYDVHSLNVDPAFNSGAYTLSVSSPAIDAGVTSTIFSTDLLGTSRPQGAAWDIGAYEFDAGPIVDDPSVSTPSSIAGSFK